MNRDDLQAWRQGAGHLCWEDLLLHLDGELTDAESRRAAEHILSCWQCRAEAQKITHTITRYVECRAGAARLNPPPDNWARFDGRLRAAAAEPAVRRRDWSRIFRLPLPLRFSAAAAAIAAILLIWFRVGSPPPVSATEVLERAQSAETTFPGGTAEPVVYRRLRLSRCAGRNTRSTQLEAYSDLRAGRERRFGGEELWPDLKGVLATNHLQGSRLLSASAYHTWRGHLTAKRDEVTPGKLADGSDVLSIRTVSLGAAPVDAIVEAGLVVRTRDWHPVKQSMRVRRTAAIYEFELSELSLHLTDRSALDSDIFGEPAKRPIPNPLPPPPVPVRAVPSPAPESLLDPEQTEVLATLALHRAAACLGEPVQIVRSESGITVRGLVESAQRKQALVATLASVPDLRVELETADEAAAETPVSPAPLPLRPLSLRNGVIPIEKQLSGNLSSQELTALANRLVSLSGEWVAHAWAVYRLREAWPEDKMARLSVASRWLLESMLREHVFALDERVRLYRGILEPHLPAVRGQKLSLFHRFTEPPPSAGGPESELPAPFAFASTTAEIRRLLEQAQEAQTWTCMLFAGSDPSAATAETVAKLAVSLSSLEDGLRRVESGVAQTVRVSNPSSWKDVREKP